MCSGHLFLSLSFSSPNFTPGEFPSSSQAAPTGRFLLLLLLLEPVWERLPAAQAPTGAHLPHVQTHGRVTHAAGCLHADTRVCASSARARSLPCTRTHTTESCAVGPAASAAASPRPSPAQSLACPSLSFHTRSPSLHFSFMKYAWRTDVAFSRSTPTLLPPSLPAHHLHPPLQDHIQPPPPSSPGGSNLPHSQWHPPLLALIFMRGGAPERPMRLPGSDPACEAGVYI